MSKTESPAVQQLTLKEELAARGYSVVPDPMCHQYARAYVRNGRVKTRCTSHQGWKWLKRWDSKVAAMAGLDSRAVRKAG